MKYRNLTDNPAKHPETRSKISEAAKLRGNSQMMTQEARNKAIPKIANAHRGKRLSQEWKNAIGRGSKRAGCRPPDNSKTLIGPHHPNWKGGTSSLRNKDLHSKKYIEFRDAVRSRDGWTCQKCGAQNVKLHAHHIKSWAENPDLRYDISNGITLCVHCHHLEHKEVPRPIGVEPHSLSAFYSNPGEV